MLNSYAFGPFDPLTPQPAPGLFSRSIIADSLEIEAAVPVVWRLIADFSSYSVWNPYRRWIKPDAEVKPGEGISVGTAGGPYHLHAAEPLPAHATVKRETITVWEPQLCFAHAAISTWYSVESVQSLSIMDNGNTCYQSYIRMNGMLAPLTHLFIGKNCLAGLNAAGQALKKSAQTIAQYGEF